MEHSSFSQILLGLDGSPYAEAATEYACQIALNYNATITGVAIIDQPGIQSSSGPVPIGGTHYDVKLEDKLLEETQAEAKAILNDFAHICDAREINAVLHADTGSPVSELIEESKFHDFIVIEKRSSLKVTGLNRASSHEADILILSSNPISRRMTSTCW